MYVMRRGRSRVMSLHSSRWLRWAVVPAMLALVAPALVSADVGSVPVVTRISGSLTVRPSSGAPHDVGLLQPLRTGDVVITGLNSSSLLALSGVANVTLGAATVVQVFTTQTGLAL